MICGTPLTLITGYAEVMRDLPGENIPENVQIIIDEATRLSTLVNDVLDLSKLQAGVVPMQCSVFNLTASVRQILTRYTKLTDYHIVFYASEDVYVHADELKISQVVYNLVNNALTYTGPDKSVTLRQTVEDERYGFPFPTPAMGFRRTSSMISGSGIIRSIRRTNAPRLVRDSDLPL